MSQGGEKMNLKTVWVASLFLLLGTVPICRASGGATSCFTCHDRKMFTGKQVHQPVRESRCAVCHNPHVARYKGLLRLREDRLCYSCHTDSEQRFQVGMLHDPVVKGACSVCHAPHASDETALLKKNLAKRCLKCHEKTGKKFTVPHAPFAQGNCTACHRPHQADNPELLINTGPALCRNCHQPDEFTADHPDAPGRGGACLSCHAPHGSDRKGLIRDTLHQPYGEGKCDTCHGRNTADSASSCLACHKKVQKEINATHNHLTMHRGNSCLNCHSPHAGDDSSLLKGPERLLCTGCHQATLGRYREMPDKHPPLDKCSLCHTPHGSNNLAMTRGDANAVCIQCHESQGKFTHPVGPDVLDSHTGQMVTCSSCHNPMGTRYKYHLKADGKKALCVLCHRTY